MAGTSRRCTNPRRPRCASPHVRGRCRSHGSARPGFGLPGPQKKEKQKLWYWCTRHTFASHWVGVIVADPNGDMLAKFYRDNDVILNPYDERGQGWTFFNEVRNDYDFKWLALSIVPRGQTKEEEEEWRQYARLILAETARKLALLGDPSVQELFRLTTIAPPDELKYFLEGTAADSLFVGADKALASARFMLSSQLPEHDGGGQGDPEAVAGSARPRSESPGSWAAGLRPTPNDLIVSSGSGEAEGRENLLSDDLPPSRAP